MSDKITIAQFIAVLESGSKYNHRIDISDKILSAQTRIVGDVVRVNVNIASETDGHRYGYNFNFPLDTFKLDDI